MKTAVLLAVFTLMMIVATVGQVSDPVVVEKETRIDMNSPQRLSHDYYRLISLQLMLEQWRRLAEKYACGERKWLQRCVQFEQELDKLEQKEEKKGE